MATTLDGLAAGTYTIDPAHTEVGFVVRHLMVSKVKGRFGDVTGTITVAENPLEATAKVDSVDTRDAARDGHLKSPDFFDAAQFPEMTFRSTGIREKGSDFELVGELTLHGVTKPVTFELEYNGASVNPMSQAHTVGFSAETEINRKDFGLEWNVALETGGVMVADKVKIVLEVEASKA
jgi:polyisoprenoid-binding protein YceI